MLLKMLLKVIGKVENWQTDRLIAVATNGADNIQQHPTVV